MEERETSGKSEPRRVGFQALPVHPKDILGLPMIKPYRAVLLLLLSVCSVVPGFAKQPDWCSDGPDAKFKTLHRVPLADSWFAVYDLPGAVFAIVEPRQSEGTISYLIVGQSRAILFDTGMGIGDLKGVVTALTKLPVTVLNSHTHNDHVGGNWQFSSVYGMDTGFTRKNAQGSSADAQAEIQPSEICGDLPVGFDPKSYVTRPWTITKFIHDGEEIDLGGRRLQVIATPGHTPDAISLLDQANGLLFTGDTFYPGTIWLYRPETDLPAYGKSIQRLATLASQVKYVLGAHGVPLSNPSVLPQLVKDFEAVRSGKVPSTPAGPGKVVYKAEKISFLMRAPV